MEFIAEERQFESRTPAIVFKAVFALSGFEAMWTGRWAELNSISN
jgi:hypothetical protein